MMGIKTNPGTQKDAIARRANVLRNIVNAFRLESRVIHIANVSTVEIMKVLKKQLNPLEFL